MAVIETLPEHFAGRMGQLLGPDFPTHIGLAVSGGGDSMAMLALTHDWARIFGVGLHVVTVDHGLRQGSCEEATMVAEESAALGHPHTTLRWHWDGQGNLQDAARRARLLLIDGWRGSISHVLFAHTQNDLAETFLMRLARGAGAEGLSAMADTRRVFGEGGFDIIRPLLDVSRADLRHHIDTLKVPYVDDPSNEDPRFDRVRVRKALQTLGIDAPTLAATAKRLSSASAALRARAATVSGATTSTDAFGTLRIDRDGLAEVERDTQLRLLGAALSWVSGAPYRPRASALTGLLDRVLAGGGGTLHGADVQVNGAQIVIFRELAALRDVEQAPGAGLWDGRWEIFGQAAEGYTIRALGHDGWTQLPERAAHPIPPYREAITLPALFEGDRLVAFMPANFGPEYGVRLSPMCGTFAGYLVSR